MNVVGKIFTVLILVMSLAFMAFALMLYAAHPDWMEAVKGPGGLKAQLDAVTKEKAALTKEKEQLETRITEEKDRAVKRIAAMEQVRTDLTKAREAQFNELAGKEKALRDLVDAIDSIHHTVKALHDETVSIRLETKAAVDQRRKYLEAVIAANDELLNAVTERLRLVKLGGELQAQLTKFLALAHPGGPNDHN